MAWDDLLPGKARPRPAALRELFGEAAGEPEPPPVAASPAEPDAKGEDWPLPGEDYRAHSRTSNKPELMLTLVKSDGSLTGLAYGDLRQWQFLPPATPGGRPVLVLRFYGVCVVVVEGRHLDRLVPPLRRHLLAWLAELPAGRDFEEQAATVITRIELREEDRKKPFGL